MSDFDLFRISEDHEALREAVREVAEQKIAPHAAAVDEPEGVGVLVGVDTDDEVDVVCEAHALPP